MMKTGMVRLHGNVDVLQQMARSVTQWKQATQGLCGRTAIRFSIDETPDVGGQMILRTKSVVFFITHPES